MLKSYRTKLDRLLSDYKYSRLKVKEEKQYLEQAQDNLQTTNEAVDFIQKAAQEIQNKAHTQLASVVTTSLQEVFEDPYTFHINFERKRNRTEAQLIFKRDGLELEDPKNEAGVGQIDIASLALRLACLILLRPRKRMFLCLDEPLKNVNGIANRKRSAALIQSLAQKLNLQIIQATGYDWLSIGNLIEVSK